MEEFKENGYKKLPRGGYLVESSLGYLQFGSPPETIKDTMGLPNGVPQFFVLTEELFNWFKGISIAEIEFPIYYNFFLKQKKTYIICQEYQLPRIKKVLQESIFGPKKIDLSIDYSSLDESVHIPEIRNEMNFFRNNLKFSDLFSVGLFKKNEFHYHGINIVIDEDDFFNVYDNGKQIAKVPNTVDYKATYLIGERLLEPYKPPLFSITCLGPSHGFDPKENTSGFIIWLNHHGIMVDPPVNSTEWLVDSNVNPKLIDSIILTHCHADHDAGTFQKILEEGRITVYSTETIMMSFLRKYAALSNVTISYLLKMFDFKPVKIDTPIFIHGGRFKLFYTLHSIPTIGFSMEFQDQSFVYTSDHNNDPGIHYELFEKNIISKERYNELANFPWDNKVIYHESGIAPLHTPLAHLKSLPDDVQERIVVYHIASKDFLVDEGSKLKLAKFGMEHTLDFPTEPPRFERAYQILNTLKHLDFFMHLPIDKAQEFLNIVEEEHFSKGDLIIKKGTKGDKFYIIYSGNVSVKSGNLKSDKIYGTYEYFGEVALVTEQERAADVYAETDVVAFTIEREKFLNFISGTDFEQMLIRLSKIRNSETWNLLSTSNVFQYCTSSQKTWLESIFIPKEFSEPGIILQEGDPIDFIYLIREGEVAVEKNCEVISTISKGDFIGTIQKVHMGEPESYTFRNTTPLLVYAMPSNDIYNFIDNNPGLLMKLVYDFE